MVERIKIKMDERKIEILRWVVCIVGCITAAFLVERSVSELQKEYNKLLAERHSERIELYSIETADKISGKFYYMGRGTINEIDYYCCYRKTDDGGMKYYKFEMDMTTIYESLKEGDQAYVEVITNGVKRVVGYKLFVPENTIIQQIDLSAAK